MSSVQKKLNTKHLITTFLFFSVLPFHFSSFANTFEHAIELISQTTYTRIRVSVDDSFKPEWKDSKNGFEIKIPGATLMDLGIPFGEEQAFQNYLKTVKDFRVNQIEVSENNAGVIVKGKFTYPTGAQALADPQIEHFDFRQTEQGKFVLDFWYKKGLTVAEAALKHKQDLLKKEKDEQVALLKKEEERRVERQKRMEDAKNALLFCDQPFDRTTSVFVRYRPDHPILSFNSYFPELIPDHRFEYTEPKKHDEESDMVKLAIKLSRDNKHALAIKTIEFLEKEYPKSKSIPEMTFLKASSFYRLEMEDKGKEVLMKLSKKGRGTEVGLQASAFLAVQAFKRQEWLLALESFLSIRREFPHHQLNWLFRYGVAECMYQIRQYDTSKAEYEWVAENAPKAQLKAEAAFKSGDMHFERSQYAMAVQTYGKAINKFKDQLAHYPHVLLNLAETYFQLEEYKRAEEMYSKFLELGRSQPTAWRSSLRLAEIKALNQKASAETEKAFTTTINDYPMTPGAAIARLRILPCGHHGGFDLAGMQRFVESSEIKQIGESTSIYTSSFKELVGLTQVRSLLSFDEDEAAIEVGQIHLRNNPSVEVRKLIEKAMIGGIKRLISKDLEDQNVYGAIAIYEKYGDYLPLPSHDPIADDLRMRLAKFAADKNLKLMAMKLIEPYKRVNEVEQRELALAISKSLNLEGVGEQEERVVLEVKTLWNSDSFKADDVAQADQFIAKVASIRDISPYVFEREILKSLFYSEQKDFKKANEAVRKLMALSEFKKLNESARAQIFAYSAEIAQNDGDQNSALKLFRDARLLKSSKQSHEELNYRHLKLCPTVASLYSSEGETLERMQKWKEAVALYGEAIENKIGGNHVLFAHARAVLKEGAQNSKVVASRSLEKIKQSQDDDVWKNLANKSLEEIAKEGVNNGKQLDQRK